MRHLDDWLNVTTLDDLDAVEFNDEQPAQHAVDVLESLSVDRALPVGTALDAVTANLHDLPDTAGGPEILPTADAVALDLFADARGGHKGPPGGSPGGGSADALTATYTSGDADTSALDHFNVRVEFYGDLWTDALHDAFVASADFLSSIISDGLQAASYLGAYFDSTQTVRTADDVVVEAYMANIDGTGGVLGRAGPHYVRSSDGHTPDGLTIQGFMQFDVADADSLVGANLWDDTVFHEMMHVLGFGTLWEGHDLVDVTQTQVLISGRNPHTTADDIYGTSTEYVYTGDAANGVYSGDSVPVENDGGDGTAGGHWDETALGNEIMTGYINATNYLAPFTVAALDDLGYGLASSDYADLASPLGTEIALHAEHDVLMV